MKAPVIPMQGRIDDIARASLQERAKARMKPVRKAQMKLTTRATFSDMPCCTRSVEGGGESGRGGGGGGEGHTGIGLNAGCDLTCADCVEVGDVLTEYGLEVFLTNAFSVYFASVDPNDHVEVCTDKHADPWKRMSE